MGITTLSGSNTGDQNLSAYAPLSSPALTGTPTAPTAASGTSSGQIATTAFVQDAVSSASALPLAENLPVSGNSDDAQVGKFAWINADGEAVFPPSSSAVSTGISTGTYAGCYAFGDCYYILTINPVMIYKFDKSFSQVGLLAVDSATSCLRGLGVCFSQAGIGHVFYVGASAYLVYEASFNASTMQVVTAYRTIWTSSNYSTNASYPPCFMSFNDSVTMALPFIYSYYTRSYLFTVSDAGVYSNSSTYFTNYDSSGPYYFHAIGNATDGYALCWCSINYLVWFTAKVTSGAVSGFSTNSQSFGYGSVRMLIGFRKADGSYVLIIKRGYITTGTQYYAVKLTSALAYNSYDTIYTYADDDSSEYASPNYGYDDGKYVYFFATLTTESAFAFYRIDKGTYSGPSSVENVTSIFSAAFLSVAKSYSVPFWLMAKGAPYVFSLTSIQPYPAFIDEVTNLSFLGVVHSVNEDNTVNVQQSGPVSGTFDWNGKLYLGYDIYGARKAHNNLYNRILTRLSDSRAMLSPPDSSASSFAESGSYTGTGTYGNSNKNRLAFSRKHKFIVIYMTYASSAYTTQYQTFIPWMSGSFSVNSAGSAITLVVSCNDTTLSWHNTSSAANQQNTSGKIYYYYAAD